MTNKEKINDVLFEVFKVNEDQLEDLKFGTNYWDSIGHLKMIGELENKFEITISPDDIVRMSTYDDILKVLEESYGVVF